MIEQRSNICDFLYSDGHIFFETLTFELIQLCHCNFYSTFSNHLESRQSLQNLFVINTGHKKYPFLNRCILCRYAWFCRPMQSQILDMYVAIYGNVKYKVPIPTTEKNKKGTVWDGIWTHAYSTTSVDCNLNAAP